MGQTKYLTVRYVKSIFFLKYVQILVPACSCSCPCSCSPCINMKMDIPMWTWTGHEKKNQMQDIGKSIKSLIQYRTYVQSCRTPLSPVRYRRFRHQALSESFIRDNAVSVHLWVFITWIKRLDEEYKAKQGEILRLLFIISAMNRIKLEQVVQY